MPTGPVLSNDTTACSLALSSVLSDSQRHMHRNQYMTQCWLQHCRRTQLMPATHAQLAQENCMKNSTQVRHSFLHQTNSPANHVARFVSRAGQFLCWNRAVLNCVQETCTIKNLYKIDRHTYKFLVQDDLHKFLKCVSPALDKQ